MILVSGIPDIIIVQIIEFTQAHITCVPFLLVVVLKLELVVSPKLLIFTKTGVNQVLGSIVQYLQCVSMGLLSMEENTKLLKMLIIVQVTAPCVCGYTHDYILDL